jgi:hypothetical protein
MAKLWIGNHILLKLMQVSLSLARNVKFAKSATRRSLSSELNARTASKSFQKQEMQLVAATVWSIPNAIQSLSGTNSNKILAFSTLYRRAISVTYFKNQT